MLTRSNRWNVLVTTLPFVVVALGIFAFDPGTAVYAQSRSDGERDRGDSGGRSSGFSRWRERSDGERREGRDSERSSRSESDGDRDSRRGSSSTATESSSRPSSGDGPDMTMADYVKSLIEKHDKNGNKMLEGDELNALRPPASLADANGDKVITVDELMAKLAAPSSRSASSSTSSSSPSASSSTSASRGPERRSSGDSDRDRDSERRDRGWSSRYDRDSRDRRSGDSAKTAANAKRVYMWTGTGGANADEEKKADRKTYRFTPGNERLPTGLPSFFKSQDKNGDGQISMSEYSRTWSRSTVSKFEEYDLDGDGVITAKEAAGKK